MAGFSTRILTLNEEHTQCCIVYIGEDAEVFDGRVRKGTYRGAHSLV